MLQSSNTKIVLLVILLAGTSFVLGGAFIFSVFNTESATDSQPVTPQTLTYEELLKLNPQLSSYTKDTTCRGRLGYIHAFGDAVSNKQPKINVLTFDNAVLGFLSIWPSSQGWHSYADQPEGKPFAVGDDEFYTKTIYLKTPPTTEDCSSAQDQ